MRQSNTFEVPHNISKSAIAQKEGRKAGNDAAQSTDKVASKLMGVLRQNTFYTAMDRASVDSFEVGNCKSRKPYHIL